MICSFGSPGSPHIAADVVTLPSSSPAYSDGYLRGATSFPSGV
ncbi:Uncharacterised protein [Mycobacterium tuberculosis]|nr:Uncharacterised protein [Mycobacterium tuberculosis]COW80835.1 Uncharacterised protein [Mycobacterium tuberculosis]COX36063.1 Uncharacterised protein [Mycobacterium tuberculosis]